VAAVHALAEHPSTVRRVAIVDFDVHHGNGTEDIVRALNRPDALFFSSVNKPGLNAYYFLSLVLFVFY